MTGSRGSIKDSRISQLVVVAFARRVICATTRSCQKAGNSSVEAILAVHPATQVAEACIDITSQLRFVTYFYCVPTDITLECAFTMSTTSNVSLFRTLPFGTALLVAMVLSAFQFSGTTPASSRHSSVQPLKYADLKSVEKSHHELAPLEKFLLIPSQEQHRDSKTHSTPLLELALHTKALTEAAACKNYTISTLLVTISDPVRSGSASEFDDQLSSVQYALGTAGYTLIDWHFNWPLQDSRPDETAEKGHPSVALYLNSAPKIPGPNGEERGAPDLLLLFLVGEIPTAGIDKPSFIDALNLMALFANAANKSSDHRLRLVTPFYTGSQASLILGLQSWRKQWDDAAMPREFGMDINIGAALAVQIDEVEKALGDDKINVRTTTVHRDTLISAMVDWIQGEHADATIAVLSEGGTQFGALELEGALENESSFISLKFPHNISQVSAITSDATPAPAKSDGHGSPAPTSKEGVRQSAESLPQLASKTSKLNALALRELSATIIRENIDVIGIVATDTDDVIFLCEQIRIAAPDTQIFVIGAHLSYVAPESVSVMRGVLVVGTYPLFWPAHYWTTLDARKVPRVPLLSNAGTGTYNAVLAHFSSELKKLVEYGGHRFFRYSRSCASSECDKPGVWISAIGEDAIYPLKFYSDPAAAKIATPIQHTAKDQKRYSERAICSKNNSTEAPPHLLLHPRSAAVTIIIAVTTVWMVLVGQWWFKTGAWRDRGKAKYIRDWFSCALFTIQCVEAAVLAVLIKHDVSLLSAKLPLQARWFLGILCGMVSLCAIASGLVAGACVTRKRLANVEVIIVMMLSATAFIAIADVGCFESNGVREYVVLLTYRAFNPASLLSPLTPMLLVGFGWVLLLLTFPYRHQIGTSFQTRLPYSKAIQPLDLTEADSLDERLKLHLAWTFPGATENYRYLAAVAVVLPPLFMLWTLMRFYAERGALISAICATILLTLFVPIVMTTLKVYLLWNAISRLTARLEEMRCSSGWRRLPVVMRDLVGRFGASSHLSHSKMRVVVQHVEQLHDSVRRFMFTTGYFQTSSLTPRMRRVLGAICEERNFWQKFSKTLVAENSRGNQVDVSSKRFRHLICKLSQIAREWSVILAELSRKRSVESSHPVAGVLSTADLDAQRKGYFGWLDVVKDEKLAGILVEAEEFLAMMTVIYLNPYLYYLRKLCIALAGSLLFLLLAVNSYPIFPHGWLTAVTWATILAALGTMGVMFVSMEKNTFLSLVRNKTPDAVDFDLDLIRTLVQTVVPLAGIIAVQFGTLGTSIYANLIEPLLKITK